jgi:predicted heme/steroid binding protein
MSLDIRTLRIPPISKAAEWISGTHLHLYREGFDDRVAYELEDAPEWEGGGSGDGIIALEGFLSFCVVAVWPPIQTAL